MSYQLNRKNNKLTITLLLIFFSIAILNSCYYDKAELLYPGSNQTVDCTTVQAKFSTEVLPLVTSKCAIATCHNSTASGGIILQNYAQIYAAKIRIYTRGVTEKSMPPTGALLPSEINIIQCWIDGGALNN